MKKITLLLIAVSFTAIQGFAQVRADIYSFTPAERTMLVNAMMEYIDADVVKRHCDHHMTTGGHIHSDFDFLPFHRTYLEGMEDYLLSKGTAYHIFVPLPRWDPSTPVPTEFQVIDPDCPNFPCVMGSTTSCSSSINWNPNVSLPSHLSLTPQPGPFNDLCDFNMEPTFPDPGPLNNGDVAPNGLSRRIEAPWHNSVHNLMGGVMSNFRSPIVPAFWLWHAYVDDIWKTWECNCSKSGLDGTFDLYMKDTYDEVKSERDRGEEPNIDNAPMWESEDIWVRNTNDGFTTREHQNPEYMTGSNYNYVYVQVRNRGCIPNTGTEILDLRWAKAGTNLTWPNHWNGNITSPALMGNLISTQPIPVIQPGASAVVEFTWQPPNPADYVGLGSDPIFWADEPWHFCLLARIIATGDPMTFTETTNLNQNVKENNNIVWKNLTVVDLVPNNIPPGGWNPGDDKVVGAIISVGGGHTGGLFDFEFKNPDIYLGNPVTAEAEVRITLDAPVWEKWANGGFQRTNVEIFREDRHQIIITGSPARINNLMFHPNEMRLMHFSFNFLVNQLSGQTQFDYQAIQKVSFTNEAIGGERFHIKIPGREGFYADAGNDQLVSQYTEVDLEASDIGEPAIYNWYDQNGNLIYTGKDFTVSAEVTEKYKLEVIATNDGFKDYDEVEVKVKLYELFTMYPNPASDNVTITYNASSAGSAYLILTQPYSSVQNQYLLDTSLSETSIDVSYLSTGVYSVILMCNGEAKDVKNLIIN